MQLTSKYGTLVEIDLREDNHNEVGLKHYNARTGIWDNVTHVYPLLQGIEEFNRITIAGYEKMPEEDQNNYINHVAHNLVNGY